ncbi:flagellar protein FlgN [Marinospirillum sp. MEB164]|uniref:Flagellar protein FlgN n=1 Tax=Marinospirillum alkalitolerans TaxID=3123374 RepID=A0ABW8PXY6_9GAMM
MSAAAQEFKPLLIEAIQHLQQLHALLLEEHQWLQQAEKQGDGLDALTEKKQALLQQVEQDVQARQAFLEAQGLTPDQAGLDAFFAQQDERIAKALSQGWTQLVQLLSQVQEANQLSARLIQRGLRHFDLLFKAVKASQGQVRVYNPAGGAGDLSIPRHLGQA